MIEVRLCLNRSCAMGCLNAFVCTGLVHCNIRLENIVFESNRWKFIDLKFLCLSQVDYIDCERLNYCYAAPESIQLYQYQQTRSGQQYNVVDAESGSMDLFDNSRYRNHRSYSNDAVGSSNLPWMPQEQVPLTTYAVALKSLPSARMSLWLSLDGVDNNGAAPMDPSSEEHLLADPSFDIWSIGCILYQFYSRSKAPLLHHHGEHVHKLEWVGSDPCTETWADDSLWCVYYWQEIVKIQKLALVKDSNDDHPNSSRTLLLYLLKQLLARDPAKRLPVKRVLSHKFFLLSAANTAVQSSSENFAMTGQMQLLSLSRSAAQLKSGQQYSNPHSVQELLYSIRAVGEAPVYDVFLSHRGSSDEALAAVVYRALTSLGIRVWWAPKCLVRSHNRAAVGDHVYDAYDEINSMINYEDGGSVVGQRSEFSAVEGYIAAEGTDSRVNIIRQQRLQTLIALANSTIYVPIISRLSLNHPSIPQYNFSCLHPDTPEVDELLLEYRMAVELSESALVEFIKPVLVGDLIKKPGQSATYLPYFSNDCCPLCSYEPVQVVEDEVARCVEALGLAQPVAQSQSVFETLQTLLDSDFCLLDGKKESAINKMVDSLVELVTDVDIQRQRLQLLEEVYGVPPEVHVNVSHATPPSSHEKRDLRKSSSPKDDRVSINNSRSPPQSDGRSSSQLAPPSTATSLQKLFGPAATEIDSSRSSDSIPKSSSVKKQLAVGSPDSLSKPTSPDGLHRGRLAAEATVTNVGARTHERQQAPEKKPAPDKKLEPVRDKKPAPEKKQAQSATEANEQLQLQLAQLQEQSKREREEFARRLEQLEAQLRRNGNSESAAAPGVQSPVVTPVTKSSNVASTAASKAPAMSGAATESNAGRPTTNVKASATEASAAANVGKAAASGALAPVGGAAVVLDPLQFIEDTSAVYRHTQSKSVGCTNDVVMNILQAVGSVLEYV
jgi:hypothetical protein